MDAPGTTTLWTPLPDGRRAAGPCPRSAPTWYPADPILFFLERRLRQEDVGLVTWCRRHCVCSRTVQRARARGYVHWTLADALACRLGSHPVAIWSDWY